MFKRLKLDNGVKIVYEKIPYIRSVSIGIWVGTGSRNETPENNGISHFVEHMLFKGTDMRTAKEIAESIDSIGGQINAFTGKECTCYYTKTLDTHIDIAIDVLADMFFHSKFAESDIKVEKKVVMEEIGMYEDSPEELVHDVLSETVWSGSTIGYPILGTQESLKNIARDTIKEYMENSYRTSNTVISAAGNFDEEKLLDLISKYFSSWEPCNSEQNDYGKVNFTPGIQIKEKDTEQIHICLGFNGIEHGDDRLYTLLAVNNIFGGGMSSRLFQKIREERGLVYSIYSYPSSYKGAGLFSIYAGMNPQQLPKVIELIKQEINTIKKEKISEDELRKSKEQLKGSYMLGLENTSSRMNSIGKSELLLGYINTPEEVLEKIDKINIEDAYKVIDDIFDYNKMGFAAVGNIKKDIDIEKLLYG